MKRKVLTSDVEQSSLRPLLAERTKPRAAAPSQDRAGTVGIERITPGLKSPAEGAACRKLKLGRGQSTNSSGQGVKPPISGDEKSALTACSANVITNGESVSRAQTGSGTPSSVKCTLGSRSMSGDAGSGVETLDDVGCQRTACSTPVSSSTAVQQQVRDHQSKLATSQTPSITAGRQLLSNHAAGSVKSDRSSALNPKPSIPLNPPKVAGLQKPGVISRPAVYYGVSGRPKDAESASRKDDKVAVSASGKDRKGASRTAGVHHKAVKTERVKSDATVKDVLQLLQPDGGVKKTKKKKTLPTSRQVETTPAALCSLKKPRDVSTASKPGRFIQSFTPTAASLSHHHSVEPGRSNSKNKKKMVMRLQQIENTSLELCNVKKPHDAGNSQSKPATFTPSSAVIHHHAGEDMEIDDAINEIRDFRVHFPTSCGESNDITMLSNQVEEHSSTLTDGKPHRQLLIVVDTNIFIHNIHLLTSVIDSVLLDYGQPVLVIPWVVLQELDHFKHPKDGSRLKEKACAAIRHISRWFEGRDPRVIGQTPAESAKRIDEISVESNDDRILQCCVQFSAKYADSRVVLLTNDINLRNKGSVMHIDCCSETKLSSWLNVKLDSSSSTTAVSSSPRSLASLSQLITRDTPPRTAVSAASYSKTMTTGSDSLSLATSCQVSCHAPVAMSTLPVSVSHMTSSTRTSSSSSSDAEVQVAVYLRKYLMNVLPSLLADEMKAIYGSLWMDVVYRKPPWSVTTLLECFHKHWIAVFTDVFQRDAQSYIELLLDWSRRSVTGAVKLSSVLSWCRCLFTSINDVVQSENGDGGKPTRRCYKGLKSEAESKLTELERRLNAGVNSSDNVQPSSADMSEADDSAMNEAVNAADSQSTPLHSAAVNRSLTCLQSVWEKISALSGDVVEVLQTAGPCDELLSSFTLFCQCLSSLYVAYTRLLSSADESSCQHLSTSLQRFIDLSQMTVAAATSSDLHQLFTSQHHRSLLLQGIDHLQSVMTLLTNVCNSRLSTEQLHQLHLALQ